MQSLLAIFGLLCSRDADAPALNPARAWFTLFTVHGRPSPVLKITVLCSV